MRIVKSTTSLLVPDIYIKELAPPKSLSAIDSDIVGFVGTFERGPVNEIVDIYGYTDIVKYFGQYNPNYTGAKAALNLMRQGVGRVQAVRVVGSGAAAASATLLDGTGLANAATITLKDVGEFGNDFTYKVENGTITDTYTITLTNGSITEKYENVTMNSSDDRYFVDLVNTESDYFEATDDAGDGTLQLVGTATQFSGGSDGSAPTSTEIVGTVDSGTGARTGLKVLETGSANIIFAAETGASEVNNELINQADTNNKYAVLCAPQGTSVDSVKTLTQSLDTDRASFTYPWLKYFDDYNKETTLAAPNSFVAGILATIPEEQSPSYNELTGVLGAEFELTESEVAALTDPTNRIMAISQVRGKYRIRNGLTLSKDSRYRQVYRRRMTDYIMYNLDDKLSFAISKPHSKQLRNQVYSVADNFLSNLLENNRIAGYEVICDETNNTTEVVEANKLIVDVRVKLLASADFIVLRVESGETVNISAVA